MLKYKDLFEFAHLQAGGVKAEEIEQLLSGADEEKKSADVRYSGGVSERQGNQLSVNSVRFFR